MVGTVLPISQGSRPIRRCSTSTAPAGKAFADRWLWLHEPAPPTGPERVSTRFPRQRPDSTTRTTSCRSRSLGFCRAPPTTVGDQADHLVAPANQPVTHRGARWPHTASVPGGSRHQGGRRLSQGGVRCCVRWLLPAPRRSRARRWHRTLEFKTEGTSHRGSERRSFSCQRGPPYPRAPPANEGGRSLHLKREASSASLLTSREAE
jgi:hypothetical protein